MSAIPPALLPQPVYFGSDGARCFGWIHPPVGRSRDGAVVLCHAIGYEWICSYRAMRYLAERLAASGLWVLRFDYHGTGDSEGDDRFPDRVRAWLDSVGAAADLAQRWSGARHLSLVGLRLGASLAIEVAAARHDVAAVVMWAPCASGGAYLREVRAFRMLAAANQAPASASGPLDVSGFLLTEETQAGLGHLDPARLPRRPAERVLIVEREGGSGNGRLASQLAALGARVETCRPGGYSAMMGEPQESLVPDAAIDAIASFLTGVHGMPEGEPVSPSVPVGVERLDPVSDASSIREQPLRFGARGDLFGLLSEPCDPVGQRAHTAIVLLNAGTVHHVGPNRMYVRWARRWAEHGFRVLRYDLGGIGESRPRPGRAGNASYPAQAVAEIRAVLRELTSIRPVERVVVVGLCSGAYHAFHVALGGSPVSGCILLNPVTFYAAETDRGEFLPSRVLHRSRELRGAIIRREAWRQLVRESVGVRKLLRTVGHAAVMTVNARVGQLAEGLGYVALRRDDIGLDLQRIDAQGIDHLMVFSAGEPGLAYLDVFARRALRALARSPRFRLAVVEETDHIFASPASQERLLHLLTEHLVARHGT